MWITAGRARHGEHIGRRTSGVGKRREEQEGIRARRRTEERGRTLGRDSCMFHVMMRTLSDFAGGGIACACLLDASVPRLGVRGGRGEEREGEAGKSACRRENTLGWPFRGSCWDFGSDVDAGTSDVCVFGFVVADSACGVCVSMSRERAM